jgi:hypothetical protein
MRINRVHVLLATALVASLAVNAFALWPREEPAARTAPSALRPATSAKPRPTADPAASLRACERRLEARQARDALRSLADGLRAERADRAPAAAEREPAELRCRIAEQQLRDRWREKAKETIADLRKSLADAAEQERNAVSEAKRFADRLGSSAADRDRLGERYRPVRIARMAEIAAAIGAEPVDYAAATAAVRGLWHDEDRLISEIYGAADGERFAADAEEGRLGVLMIIAALSGGEMPEGVF